MISTRSVRKRSLRQRTDPGTHKPGKSIGKSLWGIGSLAVACLVSPCCAPLWVPVVLSLLAGTPLAVFLSASLGWVYAGLTILFLLSLFLGWRWLRQSNLLRPLSGNEEEPVSACSIDCSCQSEEQEVKS
jgi:hypothetical protein